MDRIGVSSLNELLSALTVTEEESIPKVALCGKSPVSSPSSTCLHLAYAPCQRCGPGI